MFQNCPEEELVVDKLTAPGFDTLEVTDNTAVETLVTDVADFRASHVITEDVTVIYTATDFQGLTGTCEIIMRIRGKDPVRSRKSNPLLMP